MEPPDAFAFQFEYIYCHRCGQSHLKKSVILDLAQIAVWGCGTTLQLPFEVIGAVDRGKGPKNEKSGMQFSITLLCMEIIELQLD